MFDLIVGIVNASGYFGIAFLMLLENVFPPIPSELIMPLAGYSAARGELSLAGVILSGTSGALLGTSLWYWLGRRIGRTNIDDLARRHGRWLTMKVEDIEKAQASFDRHGAMAVFLGRLLPTIRTLISVPAGIANMPFKRFLLYSALGTSLWTSMLTIAGYLLESRFKDVSSVLNPVSTLIVLLLLGWYVYRVVTFKPGPVPRSTC